jgi:hypothetical protein
MFRRRMKGGIIFVGLDMWIEIVLLLIGTFILLSIIDAISGYRVGFLYMMGCKNCVPPPPIG